MAHPTVFTKIYTAIFYLLPIFLFSQVKISGKILTDRNEVVAYANIVLTNQADKSVQGGISDENGLFEIEVPSGTYEIEISYLGFETYKNSIQASKDIALESIVLKETSTNLDEVVVVGERAKITRRIDRLVFNIENSPIATGGNANDVLKVSPGLVLKNDEIAMLGKDAVRVMVDGRMVQLSNEDLKFFLNSISADDIKEVEIITNPPAKYEAEGVSGLINIIFKKGRKDSWNNSFSASNTIAKYGRQSFNNRFNFQKDELSMTFNLGYNTGLLHVDQRAELFFTDGPTKLVTLQKIKIDDLSSRFSLDYKINPKTTLGFLYNGTITDNVVDDDINTTFFNTVDEVETYSLAKSKVEGQRETNSFNVYFERELDTLGKKVFVNGDFLIYNAPRTLEIISREFTPDDEPLGINFANLADTDQQIKNYNAKIDFEHPSKFMNLSYGAKFSFTNTKYVLDNFNIISGDPVLNPLQSNEFEFDENIQAIYFSGIKRINDKLEMQSGLRTEYTQTKGNSRQLNQINNNNYFKIFPTLYLKYLANENNQYLLSYGKRIQRPNYSQLNPARYFINSQVSSLGNPFLTPSYNDNIELSHTYKNNLTTKVSLNIISNGFSVVSGLNDETNEQIVTFENVFERYSYSLLETFRVSLTSWWKSDISLFLNYSDPIKTKEDIDLRLYGGFEFYGSLNNSLILNDPKNIAGEVNYSYGSPYGGTVFQFSESHNLDLAVTFKSLFKGFNLTTGFYDVFNSSPRKMISEFNGIEQNYISRPSNRYFRISLAYNFGNEKISVKNRQFGNEDQRNRSN